MATFMGISKFRCGLKGQKSLSPNATRIKRHSRVRYEVPKNIGELSVVPETYKADIFLRLVAGSWAHQRLQ